MIRLGPVDVRVLVPASTLSRLVSGADVELYTHLYLRQDHVALYGFESEAGLKIFEQLLGVSGVGPKAGLALLSVFAAEDLRQAIARGDSQALARAPGVGPRAAARLVTDLQPRIGAVAAEGVASESRSQALEALVDLGYSISAAREALLKVAEDGSEDGSLEGLIRGALGLLAERHVR